MRPRTPLVWLASYPKSGNTWFRIFLTNYLRDGDEPAEINALDDTWIASSRGQFETLYGVDSRDFTADEIDRLRPAMYDAWQNQSDVPFHKVHDAYTYLEDGRPLLGNPEGQAAIYFVRNPLDVAVSFAHHSGKEEIDDTIRNMANSEFCFCNKVDREENQLRQKLLTWDQHVESWQKAPMPVLFLRYEDMHADAMATFGKAIEFLGFSVEMKRLEKAIEFSAFDQLQGQENVGGFKEKSKRSQRFFRKGLVGSYVERLAENQIKLIEKTYETKMKELAFLRR